MLNNTKFKSEQSELQRIIEDQLITRLSDTDTTAANASDYNQVKNMERSIRRERRYRQSGGLRAGGWRISAW